MIRTNSIFIIIFTALFFLGCESVSKKIDEKTLQEERELTKWLKKSESELKIFYGQPDKVEFSDTRNRFYIYKSKKFNIKCQRKFEINQKNIIVGFSSKNCF